ncbi:ATP-binding cassette domain-containing protein [Paracoccus liaowanqingii]|uniref:ATP-binding cassette domain-containing protein n=1 Tax=Paracoccus liaowanqingii TaxID=2560053 RepID=A0A4Z1CT98_9RHOB|nr:ATP-binding cassette domain-containing protein [Paracoccus liaowanqingii]TGN68752.1 ATP-binding cassette domain-containing protein [Paracoccus liaowanqingii]
MTIADPISPSRLAHPAAGTTVEPVLRLNGVSKSFGSVRALADVSVDIYPGEVHAILGENGAGKSTLMNIIAGVLQPTAGTVDIAGDRIDQMTPERSAALGISIAYQHPAVLNDLTVLENLRVALPDAIFTKGRAQDIARHMLDDVGLHVPLKARAQDLTVPQRHLLEIAKALAVQPRILIMDEPTAALDQDATQMLFERIRRLAAGGTAVIYITHRMAELRQIADRVTVLRDGRMRGSAWVRDVTDQDLLNMIVGRALISAFPPKASDLSPPVNFTITGLIGQNFTDISFAVGRGQIIGIAGVDGNGQAELMRALAGLQPWTGQVTLDGTNLTSDRLRGKAAYMPSDRHAEGLVTDLTVRENATFTALDRFSTAGLLSRGRERSEVQSIFGSLAVKTPGLDANILALSGGNQQKVVMARALMSRPAYIIADQPTQGVDVGARFEIYRILREVSSTGTPVIVNSSDAAELQGLCDIVVVMSRGRVTEILRGDDITEERIVGAAVQSQTHTEGHAGPPPGIKPSRGGWRHLVQSDNATAIPLAAVIVLLGLYVFAQDTAYLSAFNIANILLLATALGFIAMGQTIAMLMGGIDLSVGPLAGFLVVVGSFFINDGQSPATMAMGFGAMFACAAVVGTVNGSLMRYASFTPIAATLAMYIGLQGLSFVLRDGPGGYINFAVMDWLTWKLGPIPVAFIVLVAFALIAEVLLRRTRGGWQLRAVGSDEGAARRLGVRVDRVIVLGYVTVSLLTACGAIMLMAQIGVGDPAQGVTYTLSSITAVVLGGTSLRGGRGTFVGTVLGAILLTEVLNAVSFLGLSQSYQYFFQGALIVVAALIYATARGRAEGPT